MIRPNPSSLSLLLYMVLVSIIFFGGIGYLEGAQDAPDLILAVGFAGSGLGS